MKDKANLLSKRTRYDQNDNSTKNSNNLSELQFAITNFIVTQIDYTNEEGTTSTWSKINKENVKILIAEGKMTPAGLTAIDIAQQNGAWSLLDDVESLKIPKDLASAFKAHPGSKARFNKLSRSVKKIHLLNLMLAKRPDTRQKRINELLLNMHI